MHGAGMSRKRGRDALLIVAPRGVYAYLLKRARSGTQLLPALLLRARARVLIYFQGASSLPACHRR